MSVVVWEVLGVSLQECVSVNVCGCVGSIGCEPSGVCLSECLWLCGKYWVWAFRSVSQ